MSNKLIILICVAILTCSLIPASVFAGRGLKVSLRSKNEIDAPILEEVDLYENSYALLIGIDDYVDGWPRLSNARKDIQLLAEELGNIGFEVTVKENLNSGELEDVLEEFFVFKGQDPQTRLFVWFAGHGHTMNGEGFLVPADAPAPSNETEFRYKALSLRRFGELVRLAQSKHVMTIFDSCFAGTIFDTQRGAPPAAITYATTLPVRQFLASGDSDQQVADDGRFCKLFLRGLRGEEPADLNSDGYLTGSEIGMFLADRITNLTLAKQTPRYGKLLDENYDRGDFVFEMPVLNFGRLYITSEPSGADLYLAGEKVGQTPYINNAIRSGAYDLTLRYSTYIPVENENIVIEDGQDTQRHFPLVSNMGKLQVDARPKGADVFLFDKNKKKLQQAQSPAIFDLETGTYYVSISMPGYETLDLRAEVSRNSLKTLHGEAVELRRLEGYLVVGTDPYIKGARIQVNGKEIGKTPTELLLPEGRHKVKVLTNTLEGDAEVAVNDQETDSITVKLYQRKYKKHGIYTAIDYLTVEIGNSSLSFLQYGIGYRLFFQKAGYFRIEYLTGNGSGSLAYPDLKGTGIIETDGAKGSIVRTSYEYPFFHKIDGLDVTFGVGVEEFDTSLTSINSKDSDPQIAITSSYLGIGLVHNMSSFFYKINSRYVFNDDIIEYNTGFSFDIGYLF